ncbi:hypothetical protein COW36_07110 [bacterium (Candidatus Blackallbacteria) CG17_big_fil_post_rev_8_21_14_2_50_48_46]|uniref:CheW-like domain-containing protein n=1 Tax=bacterium (Candidatus Blackallbacteria) CG17_big_fil_post_rev_8_21_14_2_50_48_46 TaxID=2014261 RepID=A0A2M7G6Z8_9BACT|nr:MAG: hypothetical protein COW64_06620 [bacterium (Candidatus Blackallbacteria) CG18_big_fil_WC_8_21_14_2_50_49_26]PIW17830.1 MAG: hypothetical protein COW36_07110 [bacterium (Candidatus Blackallbacteria) CG17_big_fil_post_rev_8_21_14_2_50_48_46]PIW48506.1 MAG: hypothetical protein COW20_09065 [bacterium (Candidatus Blackallbacteria) CG13_big_fil_rev_8_21_14_2_50_49_14]
MKMSVIFEVGALNCALPQREIKEILAMPSLVLPPGMPAILAGFVKLEDQYLPVVDLGRVFQQSPQPLTIDQHLLRLAHHPWLCLVNRVLDLAQLSEPVPVNPGHSFNNCVSGLSSYQGCEIALLEISQLLLQEERLRMVALQEILQARLSDLAPESP